MIRLRLLTLFSILFLAGCGAAEVKEGESKKSAQPESKTEVAFSYTGNPKPSYSGDLEKDKEADREPEGGSDDLFVKVLYTGENQEEEPAYSTPVSYKDAVQISVNAANIRRGPHTDYPVIAILGKNTKLEVYEKTVVDGETWYHVKTGETDGWISASVVEKYKPAYQAEPFTKDLEIIVAVGNVRSGPGKNYPVKTKLKAHTKVAAKEKAVVNGETWYHVRFSGHSGWVSETIVGDYNPNRKVVLIDAPLVRQMPELPRGCEVTSLAMLLAHAGIKVDKMTLAKEVKKDPTPYEERDGKIYFGNPYDGFVGDMYSFENPGLGVYHGPIRELGEKYLPGRIVDLTGQGFEAVYRQLDKGKPVWVVVTSEYRYIPSSYWMTWHTPSGPIKVTRKMHSVLITGYDDRFIYFNDPWATNKNSRAPKADFIAGWEQLGKQAISYN